MPPHAQDRTDRRGPLFALAAALLFGASTPFAKLLVGAIDPWMLAALLYLGSGLGLAAVRLARRLGGVIADAARAPAAGRARPRSGAIGGRDWAWLAGAILAGGVLGPILLMAGLALTPASTASLLLNLEAPLTALLAWLVFAENVGGRIALGLSSIVLGAAVLSWQGVPEASGLLGPALVAAACLAWAADNNLTRKISLGDPLLIAMLKGLAAGAVDLALALLKGAALPGAPLALAAGAVGLLGYGASIALFVLALRHLGAARTGAYFAAAPFAGAALAVALLNEPVTWPLAAAAFLMGLGVWLHLTERHAHPHAHEALAHAHLHRHDAHHRHAHSPGDPPGEPHSHPHVHAPLVHAHPHVPDAHHRHRH